MEKSRSVIGRRGIVAFQISSNKAPVVNTVSSLLGADKNETGKSIEYPNLKKPKLDTQLKSRASQKQTDSDSDSKNKAVTTTEDEKNAEVPLRQTLSINNELEQSTPKLMKKYEIRKSQGNHLDDDMYSQDSDEEQLLTLYTEYGLQFRDPEAKSRTENSLISTNINNLKSFNYNELLLVNIFYTKIHAHPNGFFAENLPHWYKKTFNKNLTTSWLELIQASNKFYIEKAQNKIILYAKELKGDIDLNASGDNVSTLVQEPKFSEGNAKNSGRNYTYARKNIDSHIKPNMINRKSSHK